MDGLQKNSALTVGNLMRIKTSLSNVRWISSSPLLTFVSCSHLLYIYIYISTPIHEQDVTQGQFFNSTGLNSEFSFS